MDKETTARFEKIEKEISVLKRAFIEADKRDGKTPSVIEMDLTLPEADIDGLHFNEQKVHAVFELKEDGWYHSRDILFLSARNTEDDNSRDILKKYLATYEFFSGAKSLPEQIAEKIGVARLDVEISLPTENEGIKQYNGVDWWYWLKQPYSGSAARFALVYSGGLVGHSNASAVGGCAPVFRVA